MWSAAAVMSPRHHRLVVTFAFSILAASCASGPAGSSTTAASAGATVLAALAIAPVSRITFEVELGGFATRGEIVHPQAGSVHGDGPFPLVLLVCGNGPHDMDVTLPGPDGTVRLFAQIADTLAARGFAVARYNKRFVTGPGKFDARFWREQSTLTFTKDAGKVLDAVLAIPVCDPARVVLYGWSEGTAVSAQLATERADIKALVLQGAVGLPYRDMVRGWIADVGVPYAQGPDGGAITATDLAGALRGKGGMVAKLSASFFADPATAFSKTPAVSPLLDVNHDGELDAVTEVPGSIDVIVDYAFSKNGNCYIYAEGRTVPTVTEQASKLGMPVLILQGENDASTPARGGQALAAALVAAGNAHTTLRLLPALGHTLGPAASLIDDAGRAPSEATLVPIAEWLGDALSR
jgi:hypothetical protein